VTFWDPSLPSRPAAAPTPTSDIERAVWEFVEAAKGADHTTRLETVNCVSDVLRAGPQLQVCALIFLLDVIRWKRDQSFTDPPPRLDYHPQRLLANLASELLRRPLPFEEADLCGLLQRWQSHAGLWLGSKGMISAVETWLQGRRPPPKLAAALAKHRDFLSATLSNTDQRKLRDRLDVLSHELSDDEVPLERVDAWTATMLDALDGRNPGQRRGWIALLQHAGTATSAKPSGAWLKQTRGLVEKLGSHEVALVMALVLEAIGAKSPVELRNPSSLNAGGFLLDPTLVSYKHSDVLRGLIWTVHEVESPDLIAALGETAERCFKKVPGHGPRAPKVGNACLWTLSNTRSREAVGQLSRLKTRARHASTRKQLAKALSSAADRAGLSPGDLEDIAVPTCGLTEVGALRKVLGEHTAELVVLDGRSTELRWKKGDAKQQAGVPTAVKETYPDELKRLQKQEKDLRQILVAQRDRIERMLLTGRSLPYGEWKVRYLEHPLVGFLTRRLIWQVAAATVIPVGNELRKVDGARVEPAVDDHVSLWHPLFSSVDDVQAWREWLVTHECTQPFKQAHRELYVLTDAERATAIYSNRFASHIVKQHQLHALCQQRGWRYHLQGNFDSANHPTIELPELGYWVEFWIEPAGGFDQAETSGAGIFLYVATDQVRFHRMGETEPIALDGVPPVIFSELLRDVDLFVGVGSVGNDPNWVDSGVGGGLHRAYWEGYAFGELGETAKTRRETLARLIGKLKIADRCTLEDRFLVVRGDLRTYRIHLGSSNIQMSPDNQYLCIVANRSERGGKVMLPFEGDGTLSVILSKAFLLAEDRKIKDPTILSQLRR
jgi:hypothetical protein